MLKKLLATTALVAITVSGAYAASAKTDALVTPPTYLSAPTQGDYLATKLIGMDVYDSAAQNAESIGKISDLIVEGDGAVRAVVIGVGGFLGLGQKSVAVDYRSLTWNRNVNGTATPVLASTKDALQNAPAFDTAALTASARSVQTGGMVTSTNGQGMAAIDAKTISANNLTGTSVYSADNKDIGKVGDVLMNKNGSIAAVVLDVGGFLGIGEKPVAIAFKDLKIVADANRNLYVHTGFTKDQLEAAPTYDKNKYASNPDAVLLQSRS